MLQSLQNGASPVQRAAIATIADLNADLLLLTGIDYDAGGQTLAALGAALAQAGTPYPHLLPLRPNSGLPTGFDLNGDGKIAGKPDAMAFAGFAGERGMALLSRLPIDTAQIRDFTEFLWADLPQNLSPDTAPALRALQRLSSFGHYDIPVTLAQGGRLHLLATYAGSPNNFDGAEARNFARNHDETAFWLRMLANELPFAPPQSPFVILGQFTLDPNDGGGNSAALKTLLAHPMLQDPRPRGTSGRSDMGQTGDAAQDTVLYDTLGGLRVDYILPSADMQVAGAGVVWPPDTDPKAAELATASRHRPVWVDITLP